MVSARPRTSAKGARPSPPLFRPGRAYLSSHEQHKAIPRAVANGRALRLFRSQETAPDNDFSREGCQQEYARPPQSFVGDSTGSAGAGR